MACRSASMRDFSCLSAGTMKEEHQMMAALKTATANATQNALTNRECSDRQGGWACGQQDGGGERETAGELVGDRLRWRTGKASWGWAMPAACNKTPATPASGTGSSTLHSRWQPVTLSDAAPALLSHWAVNPAVSQDCWKGLNIEIWWTGISVLSKTEGDLSNLLLIC